MSMDELALPLPAVHPRYGRLHFAAMGAADLDAVLSIEEAVYSHPWSRGNFQDSLYSGYQAQTLRDAQGELLGYFLVMLAVDEAHLLNISVAALHQHQGLGRMLLDHATWLARQHRMRTMLLEVRESNLAAQALYIGAGFRPVGQRSGYYRSPKEDALVLRRELTAR